MNWDELQARTLGCERAFGLLVARADGKPEVLLNLTKLLFVAANTRQPAIGGTCSRDEWVDELRVLGGLVAMEIAARAESEDSYAEYREAVEQFEGLLDRREVNREIAQREFEWDVRDGIDGLPEVGDD